MIHVLLIVDQLKLSAIAFIKANVICRTVIRGDIAKRPVTVKQTVGHVDSPDDQLRTSDNQSLLSSSTFHLISKLQVILM